MSRSAIAPWRNDTTADWFGDVMDRTGFVECIAATLEEEVDDCSLDRIRGAAFVLICLGRNFVWPPDHLEMDLTKASRKLTECIELERSRVALVDPDEAQESVALCESMTKEVELLNLMLKTLSDPCKNEIHQAWNAVWDSWLK